MIVKELIDKLKEFPEQTVETIMFGKSGCAGDYSDLATLGQIKNAVNKKWSVKLSNAEAHVFWSWRSEQHDACFLTCGSDDEIVKWFEKYVNDWWQGDDECDNYLAPYEVKESKDDNK